MLRLCSTAISALVALTILPNADSCVFKRTAIAKEERHVFVAREEYLSKGHPQRALSKSASTCVCGADFPRSYPLTVKRSWILYIHFRLDRNSNRTRTCIGTIVNSNMVLTSHRCLMKKERVALYSDWQITSPDYNSEYLATPKDLIVSGYLQILDEPNKPVYAKDFTVKKIIYRDGFFHSQLSERSPESDVAILVLNDTDFTNRTHPNTVHHFPICLPRKGDLPTDDILGKEAHFAGIIGWSETESKWEIKITNNTKLTTATRCAAEGNIKAKPSSSDTLCLRFTEPTPTIEGGPLTVASKRYLEGGPWRTFLAGISNYVDTTGNNAHHKYAYFTNVNSITTYVERMAEKEGSTWCHTPQVEDDHWPWETFNKKMDESLDCECGWQFNPPGQAPIGRIVGGENASLHEFPWIVKLFISYKKDDGQKGFQPCGGSIINNKMILTASHCVLDPYKLGEKIGFNIIDYPNEIEANHIYINSIARMPGEDPGGKRVFAKAIHFHPGFVTELLQGRTDFDIAVLILNDTLDLSYTASPLISQVCLPNSGDFERLHLVGQEALLAGWGVNDSMDGTKVPATLQKVTLPIRNTTECVEQDWKLGVRTDAPTNTKICASNFNINKDPAEGDSGGPLVYLNKATNKYTQIGTVSFSNNLKTETTNQSVYYSNVEAFLPFINYFANLYQAKGCKKSQG